jgi:type II secretory pathway pseudopilin PulG
VSVKNTGVKMASKQRNPESGYTLIEFVVVSIIIFTVSAMGMLQMMPTWRQSQAIAAMDQVKSTLRQARETAISQRRTIVVKFVGTNTISLYQVVEPANTRAANPYLTVIIENNVTFLTFAGETDTPDGYGMPTAPVGLNFPGAVGDMQFQSDGTFSDSNGTPTSGTVFLGVAGMAASETAVTVMGNTGRVRSYHGTGKVPTGWAQ